MRNDTPKLTANQVLEAARHGLQDHLSVQADGYKCTTNDLLNVLLTAATRRCTIETACAELLNAPGAETVRQYLNKQLTVERLPELERELNEALVAQAPSRLWRQAEDIAVDLHDRPYYGKLSQEEGLWIRSQAKAGTTRFYRIATAYMIHRGLRVTLALRFFLPTDSVVGILKILLKRVKDAGIDVKRLFLDKGFASIDVETYLKRSHTPALIACSIRGRTGGTRALCQGNKSYRTTHTFRNQADKKEFTADIAVCRIFSTAKRTGRMKRHAGWLLFILINLDLTPRQARRLYRRRFGVETSYRCAGKVRGWTTSKNPALRFALIGLSFFLLNTWLHLRWLYTQVPHRGRRQLPRK